MKSDCTANCAVPDMSSEPNLPVFVTNEVSMQPLEDLGMTSDHSSVNDSTVVACGTKRLTSKAGVSTLDGGLQLGPQ